MNKSWRQKLNAHRRDVLLGLLIFAASLSIFLLSPVRPLADSTYALVVSQSLLTHGSFALDHFALPRLEHKSNGDYVLNGGIYQQEWVGDRLYYYLPPGSSVLSVPYVALMNLFGLSVINADGTYNIDNELKLQYTLAALLMAMLASVFFFTSRVVLPPGWSAVVALGGVLGTQVWSTASRVMWSDTWGIFLLGLVAWMLLAAAAGKGRLRPVWLASLLAWAYFVRPTNAIPIIAVTVYILIYHRRLFVRYAAAGFVWFALFVIYSWTHFHQMLPNYYLASRLTFNHFGEALAGNLVSPARGLFIYVPVLLYGIYLLVRYRKHLVFPALVKMALAVVLVHWITTSGFPHWWGGYSYGPRLMTGVVPWLVLLIILGIQAMLKAREGQAEGQSLRGWRVQNVVGGFLLLLSVCMNGIGATFYATALWNDKPISVELQSSRIWDWRYPQFLAGFQGPEPPEVFPPFISRIEFSRNDSQAYLWYGWSVNEEMFRWTDGHEATVIFSLDEITDATLRMKMVPLLVPGKLDAQRVDIELNGQLIETLTLKEAAPLEYSKALPKETLRQNNILIFKLPDAASPKSLELNPDLRLLGIAMFWLEIQTKNGAIENQARDTTAANSPLPAGGYSADVEPLDAPTALGPGQQASVRVRVKNVSGATWAPLGKSDSTYQVRLGNHWVDEKGNMIDLDDARANLPYDLRPGMEVELVLNIKAPETPGVYTLEFDMVQEHVTWFADEGSRAAKTKVTVR